MQALKAVLSGNIMAAATAAEAEKRGAPCIIELSVISPDGRRRRGVSCQYKNLVSGYGDYQGLQSSLPLLFRSDPPAARAASIEENSSRIEKFC